jgi:VWFA-related protein
MVLPSRLVRVCSIIVGMMLATGVCPRAAGRAGQGSQPRSMLVTVLDQDDVPLRDLKPADFLVREDNIDREVTDATLSTDPLFVVLLVDTTKPPLGVNPPTQDLREALASFVKTLIAESPDAEIGMMEYGGAAVMTVNFAPTTDNLTKAIQRLVFGQRSSGVLLEGIVDAGKALAKRTSPRRAIVATSFMWVESSAIEPKPVADSLMKSLAALWAVTIQGAPSSSSFQAGGQAQENDMAGNREIVLNTVTRMTGGTRLTGVSPTGLAAMLTKVAHALSAQYVVTYAHPSGPAAKVVQAAAKRGAKTLAAPWTR